MTILQDPHFSISCSLKAHSLLSCSSIIFFLFSRFSVSFRAGRVASLKENKTVSSKDVVNLLPSNFQGYVSVACLSANHKVNGCCFKQHNYGHVAMLAKHVLHYITVYMAFVTKGLMDRDFP